MLITLSREDFETKKTKDLYKKMFQNHQEILLFYEFSFENNNDPAFEKVMLQEITTLNEKLVREEISEDEQYMEIEKLKKKGKELIEKLYSFMLIKTNQDNEVAEKNEFIRNTDSLLNIF